MNHIYALLLIFISFDLTTGLSVTGSETYPPYTRGSTSEGTTSATFTTVNEGTIWDTTPKEEPVHTDFMWGTVPTGIGFPPDCCQFKTVTGQICNDLPLVHMKYFISRRGGVCWALCPHRKTVLVF